MARNKKKPAVKKDGASKKGNDLSLDEFSRLCDEAVAQAPKDNAANASSSKAADGLSTNPLITQQDRNPLPEALPRKSRFKNLAELKQWKLDQIAQEERSKQQQQQRMITYTDVDGRKYTMPAPSPDSDEPSQPEERSYDQTHADIARSGTIQRCTTFTDLNDRTVGVQTLENALQIVIPNEDPHDKTVLARPARNDELVTLTSLSEETGEEGNMVFDGVLPSLGFNGDDMAEGVGAQSGCKCAATSSLPPHVQNQINDRSSIDEDEGHEDSELSSSTWANFDTLMIEASRGCDIQWFEWVMGFQTPFEEPFKAFDCDNADFLMFGPRHEREEENTDDEEEEEQEEDEGVEAEPSSLASGCVPVDDSGVRDEVVAPLSPHQPTMEDVVPRDPPQLVTEKEKERDADDPIPPHPSEAEEEDPGPSSLAPPETAQKKKKDKKKRRKARKKAKAGPSQAGPSQDGPSQATPSQASPSSQEQDDNYIDTLMNTEPESAEKSGVGSMLALPEPAKEVEQDTDMGLTPEACPAGEDQSEGPSAPSPAEDDANTSTPLEPAQKIEELPDNTAAGIFVDSAIGDSSSCDACSAGLDPEPEKPHDKLQEEIGVPINGGTSSKHEGAHVKVKSVEQLSQENQESASDINKPPSVRWQGKMLTAVLKVTESKPSTLISTAPAASTTVSLDLKESALAQGGLKTVDESGEQVEAQTANDKMPELLPPHSIKNAPISKPETSQSQFGKEPVSMASKEEQFEPTTPAVLEDFKRPTRNAANRKVEEWLQGHEAVMDSASAMPLLFEAQQSGFSEGSNDNSDEVDGSNSSLLSFGRLESLDQPEGEARASIPGGKNVAFANQAAALPMAEREEEEVRQRANPSPPPPKHYRLEDFDYDKLVSDLLDQPVLPRVAKRKGRALSGDGNVLLVQEWRNMARRWQAISWNDEL
ncbi:hypothetical protein NpPPO83_00010220 [Neofusicoccum parvum]|uniref:Uncharacterized protein n=1 Tax=Neofusicoccum parvum TaxID=310453 RepID=A0ACB5RPD0_9PEZI|nr:hypothetical protein NpPPO83_00010220 [Neofusicoccum parvum]